MDRDKKLKSAHNDIYNEIKPREELIKRTSQLMKEELRKEKKLKAEPYKKYYKPITALACSIIILIGAGIFNNQFRAFFFNSKEQLNISYDEERYKEKYEEKMYDEEIYEGEIYEDEMMTKVAVNISGEINEISGDGKKIKVGEQWVIITDETKFEDDPDNGVQEVSREFKIGSSIAGFTLDDTNSSEVTAYEIYGIYSSEIKEYETVGEIIEFGKDGVHVITGDVADIFKVDKEKTKKFYLGEIVGVKKIGDNEYELESYKDNDFSVKHTNMGNIIYTVTGKIKEVKGNKFIMSTKHGDMEFEAYDNLLLEKGIEVTVDYTKFDPESEKKIFIDSYVEVSKIDLTVKNINRAENGVMILDTKDEKGSEYKVYVLGKSVLNFNHSDLKENDKITVYPEVIRESYPAQVDAKMIKKK